MGAPSHFCETSRRETDHHHHIGEIQRRNQETLNEQVYLHLKQEVKQVLASGSF
jgi:hypothetical protein